MATPATAPKLAQCSIVSLKSLGINEAFLEKYIEADPTVLGLGEVLVVERQRRQDKAGRLDLLLQDASEETRYEVELMLGSTDESHLIRTIEYWDVERRRYPAYDHRAVLVAEDITTRFLNVITLFSGSIPIIAIQVNAIKVDDKATVVFTRVVDSTRLREDDNGGVMENPTDRDEWISRVGAAIVGLADNCLTFINEGAKQQRRLNYNKYFIGLTDGVRPDNFVYFRPRKNFLWVVIANPLDAWTKRFEEADLATEDEHGRLKIRLTAKDFQENKELLRQILQEAVGEDEKE